MTSKYANLNELVEFYTNDVSKNETKMKVP